MNVPKAIQRSLYGTNKLAAITIELLISRPRTLVKKYFHADPDRLNVKRACPKYETKTATQNAMVLTERACNDGLRPSKIAATHRCVRVAPTPTIAKRTTDDFSMRPYKSREHAFFEQVAFGISNHNRICLAQNHPSRHRRRSQWCCNRCTGPLTLPSSPTAARASSALLSNLRQHHRTRVHKGAGLFVSTS
ncbi:hypothetical protein C8K44_1081 [Aminobacter sp. AP02]|nr:hypothetical protein C8K44_1081 [Aminobacter sp. AP02]